MSASATTSIGHAEQTSTEVVVLATVRTGPEHDLVRSWAGEHHAGARVVFDAAALREAIRTAPSDTRVVPVKVTWLPAARGRDGQGERPRAGDVLAMTSPRRPPAFVQRRLVERHPDRARVVEGEAASLGELRERFEREAAEDAVFVDFVRRAGVLAGERAELAVIGDHYKVPQLVVEQIGATARFRRKTSELAEKLDRPVDEVREEAADRLGELATVQSPVAIDAFRAALSPMHTPAWDVQVDEDSVEGLHELNRTKPLVFLPTHRSYADPLVLAEVLRGLGLPRNTMLGGNNMAFWPLGTLGKRAGVVFIRRTSGDDRVYRFALREYIAHLVSKRFNLEWYVEGGRSRTGKLRPPKMGLLSYLAGAIEEEQTDDVMMVPVSLVYDAMYEVDAMAAEQGGTSKSAEGLGWLYHYVRGQMRTKGNARVRFGTPFSLAAALDEAGSDSTVRLEKVAFAIADGINRATPATPTALVTFALLGTGGRALTLRQVRRVVDPLLEYLRRKDLPGPEEALSGDGVETTLDRLVESEVATRFDGGTEPVWSIREGRHRVAAFYRNGAVHHYVTRAVVELAILRVARSLESGESAQDAVTLAWTDALALRDLLKFEFFFPPKARFTADVVAELDLIDPNWRTHTETRADAEHLLASTRFLVAPQALRSFVDAQQVVARRLVEHDPETEIDRSAFTRDCLGRARQMLLQGRIQRTDAISTELFASALDLADNRSLLARAGEGGTDTGQAAELRRRRVAFLTEVTEVTGRLDELAAVASRLTEDVLA